MNVCRGLARAAICTMGLAAILIGCTAKKGTNPYDAGIVGSWPTDATGRYERTRENRFCPGNPLGCQFRLVRTDTVDVCSDPTDAFIGEYLSGWDLSSLETSGKISDSLYYVTARLTSPAACYWYLTLSSEDTHQPPSREGWQFTVIYDTDCQEWYPGTDRFTYTRIGDGDCAEEEH